MEKQLIIAVLLISGIMTSVPAQNKYYPFDKHRVKKNNYSEMLVHQNSKQLNEVKLPTARIKLNGDTTEECNIVFANGTLLKRVMITDSNDSTFTITKVKIDRSFSVHQLNTLTFIKHGFWKGFFFGFAGSVVFWTVYGTLFPSSSEFAQMNSRNGFFLGLILALPTGLIAGVLTETATNDDVYKFGGVNPSARSKWLKKIVEEHRK